MLAGLTSLGTTLKITQITAAEFQTELAAFISADGALTTRREARCKRRPMSSMRRMML